MQKIPRFRLLLALLCFLPLLLSACALRALFGNVIIVHDIGEEVNEIIATVFSNSTAAVCLDTDYGFFECTYIINGEIITSTLYLLGEFGIEGVLIDPVIVQVPDDVEQVVATYDDGAGEAPLLVTRTGSFPVEPDTTVTAEAGHEFLILELPSGVTSQLPEGDPSQGLEIDYNLAFRRVQPDSLPVDPVSVKVMLAGKATVNEHHYYVPMLPCVTDFSQIPALTIPVSDTPVDLQPAVGDLILQGGNDVVCDHNAYYFDGAPPPPRKTYLPLVIR